MEAVEVGAERMLDTVEQIRLKYVPSGPKRHTMETRMNDALLELLLPVVAIFSVDVF